MAYGLHRNIALSIFPYLKVDQTINWNQLDEQFNVLMYTYITQYSLFDWTYPSPAHQETHWHKDKWQEFWKYSIGKIRINISTVS